MVRILFIIFTAILIRLPYVSLPYMISLRGDNATMGLMAMDISKGIFYTFYYGQAFMGPLELYIIAPLVRLFGTSNYVFFSGAMFIFIIFLMSTYLLVCEFGGTRAGLFAVFYCIVPPFWLYQHSIQLVGYHITILVLGNLILLMTLKITKQQDRRLFYSILGLAAGLGFWNHYSIFFYLIPAGIYLIFKTGIKRRGVIVIPLFILGSLPWWIYNIRYGWRSLNLYDGHPCVWQEAGAGYWQVFKMFITYHIFGILGIDLHHITGWVLLLFYIVCLLYLMIKKDRWLFILYIITLLFISVRNKFFIWFTDGDYRHALTIFSIIPLAVAVVADNLKKWGIIFIAILIGINGWYIEKGFIKERARLSGAYNSYSDLIKFFTKNNIVGFIGDFMLTQDINFITKKNIVGAEVFSGRSPTDMEVDARDRIAFVDCKEFTQDINRLCYKWEEEDVAGYHVLYGFEPYRYYGRLLNRTNWQVKSNYNSRLSGYAIDNNLDRYWYTDSRRQAGGYFQVDLGRAYKIFKIEVINRKPHYWNNPYGYKIEVSLDGIEWEEVDRFNKQPQPLFWSGPRLYWDLWSNRWQEIFSPTDTRFLRITQLDYGPNNWMINEVFVYEYLGEKGFRLKDYIKNARKIYASLFNRGARFVYADNWLSSKIRDWSGGRIGTLVRFNECWPGRENTSRMLGIRHLRINTRSHKLTPSREMDIEFTNGVRFKGYKIREMGQRYQINYFWEISKELKDYTEVFVYFIKDGRIVYQNDHPFLEQYYEPLLDELLLERYWINLPEPGRYRIELGLYLPDKKGKRLGVRGRGLYKPTKVEIGEMEVR